MSRRLVYLVGEPGVGKTTTMRLLTARWQLLGMLDDPGRMLWADSAGLIAAVELGRRRAGGFSGTDALPMNAITAAERWMVAEAAAETSLVLAEGARLACRRFFAAAVGAGWDTHLVHLVGPAEADRRRTARGTRQNPSWVQGAATRAANIAADPGDGVTVHEVGAADLPHIVAAQVGYAAMPGWRAAA